MKNKIQIAKTIEAPAGPLFFAFSTKTGFKEWFCKLVEVNRHKANCFSFWFDETYMAQGIFLTVEKDKEVSFTWQGYGDPTISNVKITFEKQGAGKTTVHVLHSGFSDHPGWENKVSVIKGLWEAGLDNLKSVYETGVDPRNFQKPMLGLLDGGMVTSQLAKSKNLPVEYGLLLAGVLKDMGAEKAGLAKGDQITEINGIPFKKSQHFSEVLETQKVGDFVEVVFYRGEKRNITKVELIARPTPPLPVTAQELAEEIDKINNKANTKLDEILYELTEAQAEFRPALGEWTLKEILAHLIATEIDSCGYVATMVKGYEAYASTAFSNARLKSIVQTYPTIKYLRNALEENQILGTNMLAELPAEFVARKASYVRLSTFMLYDTNMHYIEHIEQIQNNLIAAKDVK